MKIRMLRRARVDHGPKSVVLIEGRDYDLRDDQAFALIDAGKAIETDPSKRAGDPRRPPAKPAPSLAETTGPEDPPPSSMANPGQAPLDDVGDEPAEAAAKKD